MAGALSLGRAYRTTAAKEDWTASRVVSKTPWINAGGSGKKMAANPLRGLLSYGSPPSKE